mgnify:CR=1 FL=1
MTIGYYNSPIGRLTVAVEDAGVAGIWCEGQKYYGATIKAGASEGDHPLLSAVYNWLDNYFAGNNPDFTLPLLPASSPLANNVRKAMLDIPYGCTVSYSELAVQAGMPKAVRAVAAAVGRNPFLLLVPCHRVVGKDGSLTGYAAGLERKAYLLELERQSS